MPVQTLTLLASASVYALALFGSGWALREGRRKQVHPIVTGFLFGMVMWLVAFVFGLGTYCINEKVAKAAYPALRVCMIGGATLSMVCLPVLIILGVQDERRKAKLASQKPDV